MDEARNRLQEAYEAAIYEVWFEDGPRRFRVGDVLSDGCAEPFAVITGYNPGGERPQDTVNEASNAMLEIELQGRGFRYTLANGHDEEWTHDEPSFAVFGIAPEQALAITRRFRQAAVFWWDGRRGSLLWV
jgi:Protein of unknown function (DUF3293)